MAKTKTKPSDEGASVKAAAPATRADNLLQAIAPKWPALTSEDRDLFLSKYSVDKCERAGSTTKSEGVLSDALGWAPLIDKALTAHPAQLRRYSGERFSWYLACVQGLANERALQQTKGGDAALQKTAVVRAEKAALEARAELVESLEELVEGDEAAEEALSRALGATDRADRIVESIVALVAVARGWLSRTDVRSKLAVKHSGLRAADVDATELAGRSLAAAAAGKNLEGALLVRDSPEVNRAEGRVLLEMRAAMRVFNRANARDKRIPKLVPGAATRGFLTPRTGKAEKPAAPPEEAPPNK